MTQQQQFEALVAVLKASVRPTEHFTLAYDDSFGNAVYKSGSCL
jgi:hypothetical protein